ncbi:MAG: hypothetical protein IJ828_12485 [Treponema sp.]|nr:hypothetical protein [Treponema sp.]
MRFSDCLKLLFPRSRLFRFIANNNIKKLVEGLSCLMEAVRRDSEESHRDLFPVSTRSLSEWEEAFDVPFTFLLSESQRRNFLSMLWKSRHGTATAPYLEQLLNFFVPNIRIVENNPVRMPRTNSVAYTCIDGNKFMRNGSRYAVDGRRIGDRYFSPTVLKTNQIEEYNIPSDRHYWETCFYVCGSVERNAYHEIVLVRKVQVPKAWKPYIEYIILQVKPLHMSAVMFIEYI